MKEQFVRDLKEGHKVLSFFLVKHNAASRRNQIFGHGFTQIFTDF